MVASVVIHWETDGTNAVKVDASASLPMAASINARASFGPLRTAQSANPGRTRLRVDDRWHRGEIERPVLCEIDMVEDVESSRAIGTFLDNDAAVHQAATR